MTEDSAKTLIGKPLVVYVKGERREIGTITNAETRGDRLFIAGKLDSGEEITADAGEIFSEVHDG